MDGSYRLRRLSNVQGLLQSIGIFKKYIFRFLKLLEIFSPTNTGVNLGLRSLSREEE